MKRWLIGLSFALLTVAAHALPTVANVEAEVQKGNYGGAETMMREVVAAKPGSARAHYILAEILAHNDRFADASTEAALAKQLDPSLKFAEPEKFRAFEQLLNREQQRARGSASSRNNGAAPVALPSREQRTEQRSEQRASGLPGWVWPVGIVVLAVLAWRMMRRRAGAGPVAAQSGPAYGAPAGYGPVAPTYGPGGAAYGPGGAAYGPGGGFAPGAGGFGQGGVSRGGGLLGAGLAAAGGVAAGMMAEKYLEHGREQSFGAGGDGHGVNQAGFGGLGPSDDPTARALEDRNIDFGNGNGWDNNNAAADAGSVDVGGGGSDGGDGDGW